MKAKAYLIRRDASGHTLLEIMLSLVLLSIVMASVGSAVMFASHAVPDDTSPVGSLSADSTVLMRITEDIASAKYVIERSATAITIVVPDRSGDQIPDRIRYAWGGQAGDPLFYQFNDALADILIDSVDVFDLSYNEVTVDQVVMGEHYIDEENEIAENQDDDKVFYYPLTSTSWIGQRITPDINQNTVSFIVSRIELYGHEDDENDDSDDPAISVEVRTFDADNGPGTTVYTTAELQADDFESELDDAKIRRSWPIPAGSDIAMICRRASGYPDQTRLGTSLLNSGGLLDSGDAGNTWNNNSFRGMLYKINGITIQQEQGIEVTRSHLASVGVSLQSGSEGRSPVSRLVRLYQAPQVVTAFLETDFAADPTRMDLDADGMTDWVYTGGQFPVDSISDGVWQADHLLYARSKNDYFDLTVADIRMRSQTGEGPMVFGPNRLDEDDEGPLALITQLRQDGLGGQELLLYNDLTPDTPIARVNGLPQGWIDLRLILMPDDELVSIHINGIEAGTLELDKVSDDGPNYTFALGAVGNDAAFMSARVRTGGSFDELDDYPPVGGYALELLVEDD